MKRKHQAIPTETPRNQWLITALVRLCWGARYIFYLMPTSIVLRCTSALGNLVSRFCKRDIAIATAQLRYVFPNGISAEVVQANNLKDAHSHQTLDPDCSYEAVARSSFCHIGRCIGEWLLMERYLSASSLQQSKPAITGAESISISEEDAALIDRLAKDGTAAVGLSAHLGSFELLAAYLARQGLKCSVIGRAPNYPLLERILRNVRESYGVEIIWSNKSSAAREIVAAVKSGRVICALIDQDTKWNSEFSSFFGLDAASPIAPIQLALRYKLPIFTSFIVRTGPTSHHVHSKIVPYNGDAQETRAAILEIYNDRLEELVCRYPSQYIWWHRRWRRRPGVDYSRQPQLLRNSSEYRAWMQDLSIASPGN